MYECHSCGRDFERYEVPGQCPVCGDWVKVTCNSCSYTAPAERFVRENGKCPKCTAKVSVPGGDFVPASWLVVGGLVVLVGLLVFIVSVYWGS